MHNIHLIRRRFPKAAPTIIPLLALLSLSLLALGLGLLLLG